ncbi:uncharacterized protein LOC135937208 isoform X3 [Cloeon dipterum]|uniref:uncharacterized protein LOC135937208 isoform X3 n=1 Tax=Cloeon dipterum TaxID=197152 RepID=UPI00321FF436
MLKSWSDIESIDGLKLFLSSCQDAENASQDFTVLEQYFYSLQPTDQTLFLDVLIPKIIDLAKKLEETPFSGRLVAGQQAQMEFSKEKISQILANAFCGRFRGLASNVNFDRLFAHGHRDATKIEKLKCLIHYFKIVTATKSGVSSMSEKVTFERVVTREAPKWHSSRAYLTEFAINTKDSMFDCPEYMAEVDFANKRIGGGVLGNGCVQEEIKFITCPELIVAKAFCDDLRINEALIMTGATPFSAFTGYASTFKHAGGARKPEESKVVVAIDAMDFSRIEPKMQFRKECIDRELLKAYTGFVHCPKNWIATGNWGCGAFRGNPELKMKIQWIAASMANKKLCYFSYNDSNLKETFEKVQHTFSGMRIGEAYNLLLSNDSSIVKRLTKLIFWAFVAFSVATHMCRSFWLGGSSANQQTYKFTAFSCAYRRVTCYCRGRSPALC